MYVLGLTFLCKHLHEHLLFYHRQEYQDAHVLVNEELSQRALSLVMKLGGGLPLKIFTCICVFAMESTIILILCCRCNLQYYLSNLHASVFTCLYIVSVQCCGITSTVELLSDVAEAMTRVWKTESTKKITVFA